MFVNFLRLSSLAPTLPLPLLLPTLPAGDGRHRAVDRVFFASRNTKLARQAAEPLPADEVGSGMFAGVKAYINGFTGGDVSK